jgi:nucleoside-diphosphate-sugar epimerase
MGRARAGSPLIVLGGGYTGLAIYRLANSEGCEVVLTSRTPDTSLKSLPACARRRFDLTDDATWPALAAGADVVWTFPAEPLEAVRAWAKPAGPRVRRLVVLGSTSAYDRAPEIQRGEWITERASLDLAIPRVQGEEWLRAQHGAIVLRVAGIYGPGRNPLNWIRDGRVRYSTRWVNLIHVEDLAGLCLAALEHGKPGETYNVSDGTPRRWSEIMDVAAARWQIPLPAVEHNPKPGKRLSTDTLRTDLGYRMQHPDLFAALEQLKKPSAPL